MHEFFFGCRWYLVRNRRCTVTTDSHLPNRNTKPNKHGTFCNLLIKIVLKFIYLKQIGQLKAAPWRKRSRVRVSVSPFGFYDGRNGSWADFSRSLPRYPLPQISFHYFYTLISVISFHFISFAPAMVSEAWSIGILAIHIP